MAEYLIQDTTLTAISEAIREKTGNPNLIPVVNLATEISAISTGVDTSDATAVANDILSGKTAYAKGEKITGTHICESHVLNFTVVGGTTKPTNPVNNTVWINTSTAISSWVFSSTAPSSPVGGMVWFLTGTSSDAAFNALKQNNIMVYPLSTKQYVSGAWKDVVVETYKNGAWTTWWDGYLYKDGDECTLYSGGWTVQGTKNSTSIKVGNDTWLQSINYSA